MTNIYIITNLLDGKQYVGKTIKPIEERFKEHCFCASNNHTYIDNAIKKYGKENFRCDLIMSVEDCNWKYWEAYCIEHYHTHWSEGGYNLSRGGDHNPMEDPECRRRHKLAVNNPDRLQIIREKATGRKHSLASRQKMSRIQRQIYSDPQLVHKVKMSQPTRFPVDMLDDNENVIKHFDSLGDACRYFNKNTGYTSSIRACVDKYNKNGKRAKFLGYYWTKSNDKV